MNHGANVFGITIIVFWIGVLLSSKFPIENNLDNANTLAITGFVLAIILGFLADKDKLF